MCTQYYPNSETWSISVLHIWRPYPWFDPCTWLFIWDPIPLKLGSGFILFQPVARNLSSGPGSLPICLRHFYSIADFSQYLPTTSIPDSPLLWIPILIINTSWIAFCHELCTGVMLVDWTYSWYLWLFSFLHSSLQSICLLNCIASLNFGQTYDTQDPINPNCWICRQISHSGQCGIA